MPVTFVTAFYVIPNHKFRSVDIYLEQMEKLIQTGIPLIFYLDKTLEIQGKQLCEKYPNLHIPEYVTLDTSWVPETVIMPTSRCGEKDTVPYFCVQLQKLWCLTDAAKYVTTSHTAWIDAGIFHIFSDKEKATKCLQTIATSQWPDKLIVPGCIGLDYFNSRFGESKPYAIFNSICWRYCGGFLLGPKDAWSDAYEKQTACVKQNLPHLVWEVNYWAIMNLFTWYWGDHNLSMIENVLPLALPPNDIILTDST
jgi:hypothetical protein